MNKMNNLVQKDLHMLKHMLKYILLGGKLMSSKELIKQLNKLGWQEVRIKGSHHQFKHPNKDYLITVPHPKRDLPIGDGTKDIKTSGLEIKPLDFRRLTT